MFSRTAAFAWRLRMKAIMLASLVAVLSAVLLQHAAPIQESARINAAVASADIELAATTACIERGTIPIGAINAAFRISTGDELGNTFYYGDNDKSDGIVRYSNTNHAINLTAQAAGDCAQHGRRLGGLSPWLGLTIGSGLGLAVRVGVLGVLLGFHVPVAIAKPISDAAGGFVGGVMSQYLITGTFSPRTFASGLFGAITSAAGGYLSARIINALKSTPTNAASAARSLTGNGAAMPNAGPFAAVAESSAANEFDTIIDTFLRNHPGLPVG